MKCSICGREVGDKQKYVQYLTDKGLITICTSCSALAMRHGTGSVVTKYGLLSDPILLFTGCDALAREIAVEEGWIVSGDPEQEVDEITEHWDQAQKKYWWCPSGEWKKDVSMSVYECFRRSCQKIRDNFAIWYVERVS